MLSPSRTTSSRRGDTTVLGTAKLRHRNSISWPTTRGRDVSKSILKEFTIASNEIQYVVIRNPKLAGPRRSASHWHRKTTPTAHPLRKYERYRKNWYISLNKSGRNAPMRLRSDFRTAVTIMNRLHRESGEERPEPIPVHQYQRWHSSSSSLPVQHGGSGMKTGGAHIFEKKFVVARPPTDDGKLLHPTGV